MMYGWITLLDTFKAFIEGAGTTAYEHGTELYEHVEK